MIGGKELCLEDYVRFFNKEDLALSMPQIIKIANINGLSRTAKVNKSSALDALLAVDLIPPGRSTVGDCLLRSSSNVKLSLDEVVKDIASIGWQECPVVSIVAVGDEREMGPISSSYSSDRNKMNGGKRKWECVAGGSLSSSQV